MKTRISIVTIFLVAIILASCAPVATPTPTTTTLPTATVALTATMAPTVMPTPTPVTLADLRILSTWVEEYVHAYGGMVTVNGVEMDAGQLTNAIRQNPDGFMQVKKINGIEHSFLVIDYKILALQNVEGAWQASSMGALGKILSIPVGSENRITGNFFSQLTAATVGGEWSQINPQEGVYDWKVFDEAVKALKDGGIPADQITCQAHVSQYPAQWIMDKNPTPEELANILDAHVTEVVEHAKAQGINIHVLITEPYFAVGNNVIRGDYFYEKLGDEYYEIVFSAARRADPDAYLILNDTDNHYALRSLGYPQIDTTNTWYVSYHIAEELIKIKIDGRPILDAIGFEMHNVDMDWYPDGTPAREEIFETMQYFKQLGLDLVVTEFDYNMSKFEGTEEEKLQRQAQLFYNQLSAALDVGVKRITFWDISDESTWLMDGGTMDGMSTPFDKNYHPKRAYYAIIQAFSEKILSQKYTPSPIPMMLVGGQQIPDPHFSNPGLFDLEKANAPIPQLVHALHMAGVEVTAQDIYNGLIYKPVTAKKWLLCWMGSKRC